MGYRAPRFAFTFLLLSLVSPVGAADLDYESARIKYERQRAIADQALGQFRRDEAEFQRQQSGYLSEVSREKQLRDVVSDKERDIQNTNNQIASLESEIPREEQGLRDLESRRSRAQSELAQTEREKDREERDAQRTAFQLRHVLQELRAEEAKTPPDAAKVARLTAEKNRLENENRRNEQQLDRLRDECRRFAQQIQSLNSQISQCQNNLNDKRTRLAQCNRARQDGLMDLQNYREDLRRQGDNVRFAQNRMEDSRRQMNNTKNAYDREELLADQAYDYYSTVVANYNRERAAVVSAAKADGSADGQAEGAERAPTDGSQAGATAAASAGLSAGTAEARTRENRTGYRNARATPSLDDASYKVGLGEGVAWADKKAISEDLPRGFNDAMAATLSSVPAKTEVVDQGETDPTPSGEDGGIALAPNARVAKNLTGPSFGMPQDPAYQVPAASKPSVSVPAVDRRYAAPRCAGLALPEFVPLCQSSYDAAYVAGYNSSYQTTYASTYASEFNAQIRGAYDAALKQAFPAEYKAGAAQGARDQGVLDGFGGRLTTARQDQYASGQAAWEAYLATGHLVRVVPDSATLKEGSGDGLFTPGEKAKVSITIDNLGKKPVPAATLRLLAENLQGLSAAKADRALPLVGAQTRVTIQGATEVDVLPARAGSKASLSARVAENGGTSTALDAAAEVHFPLELLSLTLAKKPRVNEEVDAKLKFKNLLADKSAKGSARLYVTPSNTTVTPANFDLPELEAGAEAEVTVKVKPGVWVGRNTEVGFVAETKDRGGITGAIAQVFPQIVLVDRNASILLYDRAGKAVPSSTFNVAAGGRLDFQVALNYERTSGSAGPFQIRTAGTSDPSIRNSNNSTVSSDFGFVSPGTRYNPVVFSYDIPAALKGKSVWVAVGLVENGAYSQLMQVWVNVR